MKRIIKISALVISILVSNGCSDVLEIKNISAFDPNATWSDVQLADAYLTNLYAEVLPSAWPAGSGAVEKGLPADETVGVIGPNAITTNSHAWSGTFESQYQTIRRTNILLTEIEAGSLEASIRNTIVGQALFLRAWSYFNLVRVYGGIPLILKPQALTDDLLVKRNSSLEVFEAILADLNKSIQLLAGQKFAKNDKGRIGLASALAFKGRVMMTMASPLFNPTAPYSNKYWADALAATETAKTQLESMGFGLNDKYAEIWTVANEGNKEAVLTVKFTTPNKSNGRREDTVRPLTQSKNSTGGDQPIWKHVEAYPMADGMATGTSSKYNYKLENYWLNRDPRFYANVVYNGGIFELSGIKGRRQYMDKDLSDSQDRFGETAQFLRTGFYTRKGLQENLIVEQVALNDVDWIEIRFAEVLLNYAEAANENGKGAEAIAVLKQIRKRAGIEAGTGDSYGLLGLDSKDKIREAIFTERYIEFAYEGKRFWDLKRSRKLTSLDGETQMGLLSTLKAGISPKTDPRGQFDYLPTDFDYKVIPITPTTVAKHTVPENYYFAPIPLAQIQKNANLVQNTEWGGSFKATF
jgi:starch-binding outer membrane protein, SusD/RagB family